MPSSLHRHQYELFRLLLVTARESAGLTQVQVAQRLKKPQSYVSKYERGERRIDFTEFMELVDILGVDLHQFVATYNERVGLLAK